MINRHFSDRFEPKTRERRLIRQFEIGFGGISMESIALLDWNTQHDMVLYCSRDEDCPWVIWCMAESDYWEDDVFSYLTYEEARKAFEEWAEGELQPNWEAQSEYDELHGTVNGEDPGIAMMRELWGE